MRYMYLRSVYRNFQVFAFIFFASTVSGQKVFLVHKKSKVPFPNFNYNFNTLGLETNTDTIRYNEDFVEGFTIVEAGRDSVKLKRPSKYSDTSIWAGHKYDRHTDSPNLHDLNYSYRKKYKKDGLRYHLYTRVDQYEYKSFAYKDIRTLEYPTYHGSGDGCSGCILIPGINVIWIIYAVKRWKPRRINMTKWKFVVDD